MGKKNKKYKIGRRIVQSRFTQNFLAWAAFLYMELVYRTSRWQTHNAAIPESYWNQGKPAIVCFWHNRMLVMCRCWRDRVKAAMLISHHRDGRFISMAIAHYGIETVSGSTSRGSAAALREMIDKIGQGYSIGITPDGPRGPRFQAAQGAVYLAKITGLPLIPVSVATSRRKILRSWDRFLVCLPFSRGVFVWGNPIHVPPDSTEESMESYRLMLQQDLIDISGQSDLLCGQQPVV